MDSLQLLTSDEDETSNSHSPIVENNKNVSIENEKEDNVTSIRHSNVSIEETPTFTFPANQSDGHIKFNKKSYEALRSIPSPTSTYMELEEEHRKKTEDILSQNSSSPLIRNKIRLLHDINETSNFLPAVPEKEDSKVFFRNDKEVEGNEKEEIEEEEEEEEDRFILEHNDSEQILASHEFKTGRHSRQYSDNKFLSLRTIRDTIHGSTSSFSQNLKSLTKELSDSPLKSSSKRTSRLQRLKSNSISNNISFSQVKGANKEKSEDSFNNSNNSSSRNTLQFHLSNNNELKTDISVSSNNNSIELQTTKEQFKIQTLLSQMKQLEIENERLKNKIGQNMFLENTDINESHMNRTYDETLQNLENELFDTRQELMHEKSKNDQLIKIYEEEEDFINQLENDLESCHAYTKELIDFMQTKVQNNKRSDQFQTLNSKYQIKNFEEGNIDGNFQNIYKFMNQVFELFVDSNLEKQFLREEMMHDLVESESISSSKSTINKELLESNENLKQELMKLEKLVVTLVEQNKLERKISQTDLSNKLNNEKEVKSHQINDTKISELETKLTDIYNVIEKAGFNDTNNTASIIEKQIKENSDLILKLRKLEDTNLNNVNIIEEQNNLINELYDTIDKTDNDNSNFYKMVLQFAHHFIVNLLNKIETGDKESLLKPIKKLNKIDFILSTSFQDNNHIIQGHFNALLKFIEQSVEVLIDKFNEDILNQNKALNYAIEKNLYKKWEKQNDLKAKRTLNMKK
ncbi:hypothetical protein ACO0SA_003340 [Hanseniaspora valbyensis]